MTRCPVSSYRDGTPGRVLVHRAIYELLEDGYIEVGTQLFEGPLYVGEIVSGG